MNMFNGMFGKVKNGMCRLSMNGKIAVSTSSGYKTYSMDNNRLVNCDSFVFDIGEEMFFVIPTNKVEKGDIILSNGLPVCVLSINDDDSLSVVKYEDGTVQTILPERHMFMGNTYFFGKIVSMFGDAIVGDGGADNIMKYMMLSEMMKGGNSNGGVNNMFPMMMLMSGEKNPFSNLFSVFSDDSDKE